jgi:hypothetical protein
MIEWRIKHIFNFEQDRPWRNGYAAFGFHGKHGDQYLLHWYEHWLGHLTRDDRFTWTAGSVNKGLSDNHIDIDVNHPHYITEAPDGTLALSSNRNSKIYKINPEKGSAELFIDALKLGIKESDAGNCVYDLDGNIWVNDIRGCKVWKFNMNGESIRTLGDGTPGFQKEPVSFNEVRFNWIYDLRLGPDGNMYVLDSKNFAVRMIDIANEIVTTVVGTGESGYSGDGGDALEATLGSNKDVYFDGPLSLSLDEDGNIFIGDTRNHVMRMVDRSTNIITTIAGKRDVQPHKRNDPQETDPLQLNLPQIASLDYYDGCLFIPEDDGDLIVLEKV